jgi:hypothetical protein
MRFSFYIAAIAGLLGALSPSAVQALSGRLEAQQGEFSLHLDDGRVLARDALVGSRIVIGRGAQNVQVLIESVEEETLPSGAPVVLYRLLIEDPKGKGFQEACEPDAKGRRLGLPLMHETGIAFTCTSGAEGKCILMGYRPWEERADAPMQDLHAACIHLMRADYGGDDHPATLDGTLIDVYDRFGIQKPEAAEPMPFEAAWGRDGAVCVAHPRIAQNVTLEELANRYPWLRTRLGPDACTEEAMRHDPEVLLFNRSARSSP